jgi:hypothetical protein
VKGFIEALIDMVLGLVIAALMVLGSIVILVMVIYLLIWAAYFVITIPPLPPLM